MKNVPIDASVLNDFVKSDPRYLMSYDPYGNVGNATSRYAFTAGEKSEAVTVIGVAKAIAWIITNPPTPTDWVTSIRGEYETASMRLNRRHELMPCPTCTIREARSHTQ